MGAMKGWLLGLAVGAGAAYFYDPGRGAARRKALLDDVRGFLDGEGPTAGRIQGMLACPLTPEDRALSGAAGAAAWLLGSRVWKRPFGALGVLLLYRALANPPAHAGNGSAGVERTPRKRPAQRRPAGSKHPSAPQG
jgi:hypothetical protein